MENLNIHFIGLGDGGSSSLDYFFKKDKYKKAKFTLINDEKGLLSSEIDFIPFFPPNEKVFKLNDNNTIEFRDYEKKIPLPKEIIQLCRENHQFVLLAGLGGYTGTYLVQELTTILLTNNKEFTAICTIPAEFEGSKKRNRGMQVCLKLKPYPTIKCIDPEFLREKYGNMGLTDFFEKLDKEMLQVFNNKSDIPVNIFKKQDNLEDENVKEALKRMNEMEKKDENQ